MQLKDVIPYEQWYNKKPGVGNLEIFGCKAFVPVPDAKQKGKLRTSLKLTLLVVVKTDNIQVIGGTLLKMHLLLL